MVSIILSQARERDNKIASIVKSLKENPDQDLKIMVLEICNIFNCSLVKAKEYIEVAKWKIQNDNLQPRQIPD